MSEGETHAHSATNVKITRDKENWEIEVKAEIPANDLKKYRAEAIKEIQKTASLPGFRPGHAPESEIIRAYGEGAIMRRAAEIAIQNELPEILAAEKLPIVETPRVTIEDPIRLADDKPLAFTARAALAPEIELPDYKEIAKRFPKPFRPATVSEEEHAEALGHLRRERARIEFVEKGKTPQEAVDESRRIEEKDLPVLDDEFAKSIGYETAERFRSAVRTNMQAEKSRAEFEKRRSGILDAVLAGSKIRYPATLCEYELDDIEARLSDDLTRMGTTLEAYLSNMPAEGGSASGGKKTREQLRAEWKNAADKRARTRLVLAEIARKENIEPEAEELEREITVAKKHYPNAEDAALRSHIAHALRNEAVLTFLENL